jgi:hypothetical protein
MKERERLEKHSDKSTVNGPQLNSWSLFNKFLFFCVGISRGPAHAQSEGKRSHLS